MNFIESVQARVQAMGTKLLPPSEKINNSQNLYPILRNNISFQSLNTGNNDMVDDDIFFLGGGYLLTI